MTEERQNDRMIPREQMMFIIYVAIFGVIWGLGTSILAGALPPDPITRVLVIGWFEAMIMLLTKVVLRRRISIFYACLLAATISIFTFSFGPPNPYKPLFALAGLAFDAGSYTRKGTLRWWNLLFGAIAYILAASAVFIGIFWLIDEAAVPAVVKALPVAGTVFVAFAAILAVIYDNYLLKNPPAKLVEMWRQIGGQAK